MNSPIHVAFLSEHASPVALLGSADAGGQNVYIDEVSRGLATLGYAVDIFTRRTSHSDPHMIAWAPGVRVINLECGPLHFLPKDDLWPLMPEFRQAILRFMLRDGVRYDLLHGNFWMSGHVACQLRRQLDIPTVQIFHAMGKTKQQHQGDADTSPSERIAVELEIVRQADRLIAQCPSELTELVEDYGADPGNVVIIPSAVNCQRFYPIDQALARQRLGLDPNDLIVVYVGRLLPRKDIRNIVRALAILVQRTELPLKLLVVGGETAEPDPAVTPEIGVLQALAAELGVADRLIFTGKRQPDLLYNYYGAGDVVVTTPWYEPFGLTPLEAMACGRPVIGSAVGGISFTVQDGVTGALVPPRNPEALAERLQQLLTRPIFRTSMGRAARARVEREFTWATVARRTAMLYDTLLYSKESSRITRKQAGHVRNVTTIVRQLSEH